MKTSKVVRTSLWSDFVNVSELCHHMSLNDAIIIAPVVIFQLEGRDFVLTSSNQCSRMVERGIE